MPGIAQVFLTEKELDALIQASTSTHTRVSERLWRSLGPKLEGARGAVACPVPSPPEKEKHDPYRRHTDHRVGALDVREPLPTDAYH